MNQGNPYESVMTEALRDLHQWLERRKNMEYGWTTTKTLHEERVNQLLQPSVEREPTWNIWPRRNPLRLLSAVRGLFRWQPATPIPDPTPRYDADCHPETAC